MRSLYLRVWLTVVAVLAVFALGSTWLFQRQVDQERSRVEGMAGERMAAWGELIQRSLPGPEAPASLQAAELEEWSSRLRIPLALDSVDGRRLAESSLYGRRVLESPAPRALAVPLDDGRTLWILRPPPRPGAPGRRGPRGERSAPAPLVIAGVPLPSPLRGAGLVVVLAVLFAAIAAGAFPVVRRLTRRLEALQQGVERFGAGTLSHRVDASGRDEVAAVAASFNRAADRVEALLKSHQSLLANASHELRSPLARLKMALALIEDAGPAQREALRREIETNIGELDGLVEEVLLASRLDAQATGEVVEEVELLGLAAEEAARIGVSVQADEATVSVLGEERLLRRAVRNLLENAQRYGGDEVSLQVRRSGRSVELLVCDRGPGVPEPMRERIFEPFFRLPGHAEREGGVGLGLSLVRQIALRHQGSVRCDAREGGGSCFVLTLPATP